MKAGGKPVSPAKKSVPKVGVPVEQGVRIQKIENGYLAHHTTMDKNSGFSTKTVYHAQPPLLSVESKGARKFNPGTPPGFEQSRFDNDRGVKEGSKADMKRDAKEIKAYRKAKGK